LKPINRWCTASLSSHFFSRIWHMQNIWSLTDLLHSNPHWGSPVISFAYRVNFDSTMLDRILYVTEKSDMSLQLLQSALSPFFYIRKMTNSFHCSDSSSLFQIRLWISQQIFIHSALTNNVWIWSIHYVLCLFSFSITLSNSTALGSGTNIYLLIEY
jgi:hypothetical protein